MGSVPTTAKTGKPTKPYADFPLFPHATKRWAKKIRGKLYYFGPWNDPEGALQKFLDQRDALYAGRKPRTEQDGLTVRDLLNSFLTSKQRLLDAGDIVARTFRDYKAVCERVAAALDLNLLVSELTPTDFETLRSDLAKSRGPTSLANDITRIRMIFKYANDSELIDRPVRFGQSLKKPSKKALRLARLQKGPRMFEAEQILALLDLASEQLQAMILLGINCGFGNHDCGTLPISAVDLNTRWVDFPRPKTANPRKCPLWNETVTALQHAIKTRPKPVDEIHGDLVFLTSKGRSWAKDDIDDNPISKETVKLLKELGYHRPGLSFYALRHTFETIGAEAGDQVAVNFIMGHVPAADDMPSVYRQRIEDERLVTVTDYVRDWLFNRDGSCEKAT